MAAEHLAISQPAVSQSIKMLESAVGTRLFIRTSRGVRLTAEGELLAGYVSAGYEQIELGEKKLMQMLDLEIGELRIGASDMTLRFYLLPYLERFHEKYPGIKVTVSNAPTPETLASLLKGKIDFGVVSTPFDSVQGIRMMRVKAIEDIFYRRIKIYLLQKQDVGFAGVGKSADHFAGEKNEYEKVYGLFSGRKRGHDESGI